MACFEIRRNLPEKGKGLFATKEIKEDDIIFEESPLVCAQFPWNAFYNYLACDHCMRSLEPAQQMIARLCEKPEIGPLPYPECCGVKPEEHVQCPNCGVKYCSSACRDMALQQYHKTLCLGSSILDENHPINKLVEIWKNIHFPPETCSITLLLRMIATVHQSPCKEAVIQRYNEFCSATANEQQEIAHKLLGTEFQSQLDVLRNQLTQTLYEESLQQWYTPEGFQALFAMIGTNGQGIGTSSVSVWVKAVENLDLPEKESEEADNVIDKIYEEMNEASGQFLDCEGSGLYVLQSACNHSCVPNAEVSFPDNNFRLCLRAIKDIAPGEEICISYLDECAQSRSRHSRQKTLRENYIFNCACPKCLEQADDPDVTSDEDMESDEDGDRVVEYK